MDHLWRLIWALLLCAVAPAVMSAPCTKWRWTYSPYGGDGFPAGEAACAGAQAYLASISAPSSWSHTYINGVCKVTQNGAINFNVPVQSYQGDCNLCEPLANQPYNGLTCDPEGGCRVQISGPAAPPIGCHVPEGATTDEGCEITGDWLMRAADNTGQWWGWLKGPTYTGGECTSTEAPAPEEGDQLPPGKCKGTVNGVEVVVDCKTTSEERETEETKEESSESSTDPEGTKTTESTTCEGNRCTTTKTTTVVKDGTKTTTTTTTTTDKGGLCKENPNLNTCKNSTFNGSCNQGWACNGDAAVCATAKAVNDAKCLAEKVLAGMTEDGEAAARAFMDGQGEKDPKEAEGGAREVDIGTLQDVANPFADSCPADVTFDVMGHQFALPLSQMCDQLKALGVVLHMFTLLFAVIYVIRGV